MKRLWMFALIIVLAACGTDTSQVVGDLPTIAVLPTVDATITADVINVPSEPTSAPIPNVTLATTPTTTHTATIVQTATVTVTPSQTITDTPTLPPSATHTITPVPRQPREPGPLELLADLARQATVLPLDFTLNGTPLARSQAFPSTLPTPSNNTIPDGVVNCTTTAPGGFGTLENTNSEVRSLLGCALGNPPAANPRASAYQSFENGFMVWVENPGSPGTIYVANDDGTYRAYPDTWQAGIDPDSMGEQPPAALLEPIRGFGKVWRSNAGVRDEMGWARAGEVGGQAIVTQYERGLLIYLPQRNEIVALGTGGLWRGYPGIF